MIVLGNNGLKYKNSYNNKAIFQNGLNNLKVSNGIFKEILISNDILILPDNSYPEGWNTKMVLHAIFRNGELDAGNSAFNTKNTTDILIKRREKGSFNWMTIYHKDINRASDFNISVFDNYARNGAEYEYALVQIIAHSIEGEYVISESSSSFEGYYLIDKDNIFNLLLDLKLNREMNSPRAFITGLNKQYPTVIKNTKARYLSGDVTVSMMNINNMCLPDEKNAWKYRDDFLEFLLNGQPKFFKTFDNKCYAIIDIQDVPSESDSGYWNLPSTSFSFVQIGSAYSENDLVVNGLLDLDSEWWSI